MKVRTGHGKGETHYGKLSLAALLFGAWFVLSPKVEQWKAGQERVGQARQATARNDAAAILGWVHRMRTGETTRDLNGTYVLPVGGRRVSFVFASSPNGASVIRAKFLSQAECRHVGDFMKGSLGDVVLPATVQINGSNTMDGVSFDVSNCLRDRTLSRTDGERDHGTNEVILSYAPRP